MRATAYSAVQVGRWVTEKAFSDLTAIPRQTLANWRSRDRAAGRAGAAPGYPEYRRFGRAIRYRIEREQNGGAAA
jgi:hypothetical protein